MRFPKKINSFIKKQKDSIIEYFTESESFKDDQEIFDMLSDDIKIKMFICVAENMYYKQRAFKEFIDDAIIVNSELDMTNFEINNGLMGLDDELQDEMVVQMHVFLMSEDPSNCDSSKKKKRDHDDDDDFGFHKLKIDH